MVSHSHGVVPLASVGGKPSLSHVPLFVGLPRETLRYLESRIEARTFDSGDIIFHKDDPGEALYIIKSGKIRICTSTKDGREVTIAVLGAGDFFGEMALLDGEPRSADAVAVDKVETLVFQREPFLACLDQFPEIAKKIIVVLSKRLRLADEQIGDLIFLDVHGRVAKKLLDLAATYGVEGPRGIQIGFPLTQKDLASVVGTSRESVNKVLRYYQDRGYITFDTRKITILHPDDLHRRASY